MQVSGMNYTKFINYISTQQLLPSVQTIANHLNLSNRKIYYLLQAANSELRSVHQPFLVPNLEITGQQVSALTTKLSIAATNEYINSYDRQLIMSICIALPLKKWTLSEFQLLFDVSRNTVLRDISELKKRKKFKPEFSKKNGFEFNESLFDLLVNVYNNLILLQYHASALEHFIHTLDCQLSYSKFLLVSDKLKNMYKSTLKKQISASSAMTLTIFSVLASLYNNYRPIISVSALFNNTDIESFKKRQEHHVIKNFALVVTTNFAITMPTSVKLFLTLQLLSVTKEQDEHFSSHSFQDLLILSEHIVNSFMDTAHIDSTHSEKKALTRDIQTQLKPFWYSVRYQSITVYDYLYHEPMFENDVKKSLNNLPDHSLYSRLFPFGLLPDQITILAMIFYNFNLQHQEVPRLHILMLTSLPIYSQNLFQTFIEKNNVTPCDLTIKHLTNTDKSLIDNDNFDLIITESTDIDTKLPTFLIDRELTNTEFDRLKTVLSQL
ncbi:transcriptional antiterminator [Leuconostoc gelidum subsp. aenigmaticum]|uniref:transcriptional antiterminator n=1 Tax=Leuconostoc gelidum TaxID=1244 RepID=UPI001C7DC183|nr:transcriptional antiterminator [Leuconostoc gelidum]MBZ6003471.1 transcriptional antiterminator [Leuconostoc gelidum subsp. aenigmaticum]MBZ6009839.1 transcriptional antiterminator [Leuconostoc gelidum subsp. aenigmaticum]